ncbi:MAG: radical SAM protein [Candidatus Pacearchaeota archaeon]
MVRRNPKRKIDSTDWKKALEKMNYAIVGDTSAVQICLWTKNSLRGKGGCWKEKFYGISAASCCQMTPSVMWCENRCVHCWRPIEMSLGTTLPKIDEPKEILDGIVEARKKLLEGFRGRKGVDLKKYEEALEPKLYTMSLSGEPTLYPKLGEMFKEIRRRGAVSFLVTNGLNPDAIESLKEEELPTQITVSTNAPNEKLFIIWHRSCKKDAWKEFNQTLDVIRNLKGKVRRVIRLTLVKKGKDGKFNDLTNMSEENIGEYSSLIKKAEPDFIHIKGFKSIGYARERLGYDRQPWFSEVKEYALKILGNLEDYEFGGEDESSCVVMLKKKDVEAKIKKI